LGERGASAEARSAALASGRVSAGHLQSMVKAMVQEAVVVEVLETPQTLHSVLRAVTAHEGGRGAMVLGAVATVVMVLEAVTLRVGVSVAAGAMEVAGEVQTVVTTHLAVQMERMETATVEAVQMERMETASVDNAKVTWTVVTDTLALAVMPSAIPPAAKVMKDVMVLTAASAAVMRREVDVMAG